MTTIVRNRIKEINVKQKIVDDSLLSLHVPNMELKDHEENLKYLNDQINKLIEEINKEIEPFCFQISNIGRNFFYELLFSEYWSFIQIKNQDTFID